MSLFRPPPKILEDIRNKNYNSIAKKLYLQIKVRKGINQITMTLKKYYNFGRTL